jgi:hypothetical protein
MNVRTRVRLLWVGLGTYLLILLNDIRYLRNAPLYIVVLGILLNVGIVFVLVSELRKSYKKLGEANSRDRSRDN